MLPVALAMIEALVLPRVPALQPPRLRMVETAYTDALPEPLPAGLVAKPAPAPFEKDFTKPMAIPEEGIMAATEVMRSGRLFRYCAKDSQVSHAEVEFAKMCAAACAFPAPASSAQGRLVCCPVGWVRSTRWV